MSCVGKRFSGSSFGSKMWGVEEKGLAVGSKIYPYEDLREKPVLCSAPQSWRDGWIDILLPGDRRATSLMFTSEQNSDALEALSYIMSRMGITGEEADSFLGKPFTGWWEPWGVREDCLFVGDETYPFDRLLSKPNLINTARGNMIAGLIEILLPGNTKPTSLMFNSNQQSDAFEAIDYITSKISGPNEELEGRKFHFVDKTGSTLDVFDDYVLISLLRTTLTGFSEVLRGGSSGTKRINISDITAITFREPAGIAVGYIQFAYPGSVEAGGGRVTNAVNDENSVLVDYKDVEIAREIVSYIESRRSEIRSGSGIQAPQVSAADEIRKFKGLLDDGIITQEEFDAKKKLLLGI